MPVRNNIEASNRYERFEGGHNQCKLTSNPVDGLTDPATGGSGLEASAKLRQLSELEREIPSAIKSGEIRPYYQPILSLVTGAVVGCEVLARWNHPTHGLLLPLTFIPIAKATGCIGDLTYAMLRQAIRDAQTWPQALSLSLNLSPHMAANGRLPDDLLQILKETDFPANRLELEITENTLIERAQAAKAVLASVRSLGVRITLDDFGVGYSGLSYLRQFEIDRVKIDRSFVREVLVDPHDRELVGAMVTFCHSLGLSVTAEGIESSPIRDQMVELGCDLGQGYFFSKPKSNSGFLRYLNRAPIGSASDMPSLAAQVTESGRRVGIPELAAFDLLSSQIAVLDLQGGIAFTNQAWKETADRRLDRRHWNYLEECRAAEHRGCPDGLIIGEAVAKVLRRELVEFVATYSCPFDRRHHWFQVTVRQPRESDEGIGAIVVHTDVTALQHDHLTGLANRALFESQAQYALETARQYASAVGFALIDLDGFKPINDQFGHAAGDRALIEIAQRLSSAANNGEVVARLGGDEFGVVTWLGCNEVSLGRLVRNIETAFDDPYVISGSNYYLSASVGTAVYPDDGETLTILLRRADSRMYGLKIATRSRQEKWTA